MKFEAPKLEVMRFNQADVITTSGFVPGHGANVYGMDITYSLDYNKSSGGSVNVICPVDGLTYGVDFICNSGYNA